MKKFYFTFFLVAVINANQISAQLFEEQTDIELTGIKYGSIAWGDYNNDGYLDILLTGDTQTEYITKIYKNNGDGTFAEQTGIDLTGVKNGQAEWGDYDNDGYIDILMFGETATGDITKLYKNNGDETFTEQTSVLLPAVSKGCVAWGDFYNNGYLDILITGETDTERIAKVFKNNKDGSFTEQTGIELTGVRYSAVALGDYDNDGDMDILITGFNADNTRISKIYKNTGKGNFSEETGIDLTNLAYATVVWGDYDNDGCLDILMTGHDGGGRITKLYKNDGAGGFVDQLIDDIPGVRGTVTWGDYDNDGYPDILLSGEYYDGGWQNASRIYKNNGDGTFTEQTSIVLVDLGYTARAAWGDYDNDGKLDIVLAGPTETQYITTIYKNLTPAANTIPGTITNLQTAIDTSNIVFSWNKATDADQNDGLNYNLYLYEEGQAGFVQSPHAFTQTHEQNGKRLIAKIGNIQGIIHEDSVSYLMKNVFNPEKSYYWSVQAIDAGLAGGEFAEEQAIKLTFIKQTDIGLEKVHNSSVAWGDYNNDGYLDILLTGYNSEKRAFSGIYKNNGDGTFSIQPVSVHDVYYGCSAWGDYDNDGYLDFIVTGRYYLLGDYYPTAKIYKNNGDGTFSVQNDIDLPGVYASSVAWGDYNNDGYLDILFTGWDVNNKYAAIYSNNGDNTFTELAGTGFPGVYSSCVAWGDYNNDGYADIFLSGSISGSEEVSTIYKNNGDSTFTEQTDIILPQVCNGDAAWGDYDNDGYLDLLLTGYGPGRVSAIFRNDGAGNFTEQSQIDLIAVNSSAVAWGDYDNDGYPDILLSGSISGLEKVSIIYKNMGDGTFTQQSGIDLADVNNGSVSWADYNNDGRLDILLTGLGNEKKAAIYKNNTSDRNTIPDTITNLQSVVHEKDITFSWDKASDEEQADGLSYRLYVYEEGQSDYITPPHALPQTHALNGKRLIAKIGDIQGMKNGNTVSYTLRNACDACRSYYWSVHAIDAGLAGGAFSEEQIVIMDDINPEITSSHNTQTLIVNMNCEAILPDYTTTVIASDNCDENPDITQSPLAGSNISGDNNTVVLSVTDDAGNRTEITFDVEVTDTTKPVIACAGPVNINADQNNTYTVSGTEFDPVEISDNCEIESIVNDYNNQATLKNEKIQAGTYSITWTVTDYSGNAQQCISDIIVNPYTTNTDMTQKDDFSIYPNPTSEKVTLEFAGTYIEQIKILNLTGKTILQKSDLQNNEIFDLSGYEDGIYIMRIWTNNKIHHVKLVKE